MFEEKTVSRREFLKIVGIAGATVGVGAGMGGILAACGSEESATTTTTTAASATTETTMGTTTSVSVEAQTGREIKLGFVTPQTGPLALFGAADKYCVDHFRETVGETLLCGDGQKHPVTVLLEDGQSNSNRAAQVAGDLIQNSKVDILMAASTGDNVAPVADQAEAYEVPCIATDDPWQAYFFGRKGDPKVGFKWTYLAFWGQEDQVATAFDLWKQVDTNKAVGVLWPNNTDGNSYRQNWPEPLKNAGYTVVDGGAFPDQMEDFTSVIDAFKKGGAEIVSGAVAAPDFANFWKQCKQQNYNPKICHVGKALNFPSSVKSLGDIAEGLVTSCWWHPTYPFTSPLTGENCQQFADNFTAKTGEQWTQPLLHFMVLEWAGDVLKRVKDLDDKNQIIEAVRTTKMETIVGPVDFTQEVGAEGGTRPVINVVRTALSGGQWRKSEKWGFDLALCSNAGWPMIPVNDTLVALPGSGA